MSKGRLFQQILKNRRISQPQTLVLAGAANAEVLNAVCQAERDGYITPVLVGVKTDINNIIAENFPEKLDAWEVVHAVGEEEICETSVALIRSRPRAFLSKGLVNTGPLCKALFRHKKEFGIEGLVSHISLLELPWYEKVLGLSDSSINIAPSIDEKEQILKKLLPTPPAKPEKYCPHTGQQTKPNQ